MVTNLRAEAAYLADKYEWLQRRISTLQEVRSDGFEKGVGGKRVRARRSAKREERGGAAVEHTRCRSGRARSRVCRVCGRSLSTELPSGKGDGETREEAGLLRCRVPGI